MKIFGYIFTGICIFVISYLGYLKAQKFEKIKEEKEQLLRTIDSLATKLKECDSCYKWNYRELEYLYNQRKK